MDSTAPNLRLKFFFARQAEGKHSRNPQVPISDQVAAVLAAVAYAEDYADGRLSQKEIRYLLSISPTRASNLMSEIVEDGLLTVEKGNGSSKWYRIQPVGKSHLATFADQVLGMPERIEVELQRYPDYQSIMQSAWRLIDKDIHDRYAELLEKRNASQRRKHRAKR